MGCTDTNLVKEKKKAVFPFIGQTRKLSKFLKQSIMSGFRERIRIKGLTRIRIIVNCVTQKWRGDCFWGQRRVPKLYLYQKSQNNSE